MRETFWGMWRDLEADASGESARPAERLERPGQGDGGQVGAIGEGARPVAEADVAVDDAARLVGGVQDFFGVDRNKNALLLLSKGQQLVERAERVDLDAVERHPVVGYVVVRTHLKRYSYRFSGQR